MMGEKTLLATQASAVRPTIEDEDAESCSTARRGRIRGALVPGGVQVEGELEGLLPTVSTRASS